jgi:hypothetical protein
LFSLLSSSYLLFSVSLLFHYRLLLLFHSDIGPGDRLVEAMWHDPGNDCYGNLDGGVVMVRVWRICCLAFSILGLWGHT